MNHNRIQRLIALGENHEHMPSRYQARLSCSLLTLISQRKLFLLTITQTRTDGRTDTPCK